MAPNHHALLGPSSADRWLHCPPSARLGEKFRERFGDRGSVFAQEGTVAHAVAELKLRKELKEINDFSYKAQVETLQDRHPEMDWKKIEWATNVYVDVVMSAYYEAKRTCPDAELLVEQRYDLTQFVPGSFGTSDATIVSDTILHVLDFKMGAGVPVSAIENPQARLYGLGAVVAWGDLYGFKTVRNTIVQPNLDSVSSEDLTRDDLLAWGAAIAPAAEQAWAGSGEFAAGDWCRFCPAKALCYHRATQAMSIFRSGLDNPGILPDEEIPRILEVADVAEAWIKDIREYAKSQALKGVRWPGFKLVAGRRPPRKWTDTEAVIDQMSRAGYTDDQIYKPREVINPGEAEKLLGKAAFRAILGPLSAQGDGVPTLVPESDKRLSINSSEAAFADLSEF